MAPHVRGDRFDGRARRSDAPRRYRIADRCRPSSDEDDRHPGSRAGSGDGVRVTIKRSIRCSPLAEGNLGERCARHGRQSGGSAVDRKTRFVVRRGSSTRVRLRRPPRSANCHRTTGQPAKYLTATSLALSFKPDLRVAVNAHLRRVELTLEPARYRYLCGVVGRTDAVRCGRRGCATIRRSGRAGAPVPLAQCAHRHAKAILAAHAVSARRAR